MTLPYKGKPNWKTEAHDPSLPAVPRMIYVTTEMEDRLQEIARRDGLSISELGRRAIQLYFDAEDDLSASEQAIDNTGTWR